MEIISKNNEKFNEFEEKTYKELMKEGIKRTQEWFRKIDEILLKIYLISFSSSLLFFI